MIIFQCDGCGKQKQSLSGNKPYDWFARTDFDEKNNRKARQWHACSRTCIDKAAQENKITKTILPV